MPILCSCCECLSDDALVVSGEGGSEINNSRSVDKSGGNSVYFDASTGQEDTLASIYYDASTEMRYSVLRLSHGVSIDDRASALLGSFQPSLTPIPELGGFSSNRVNESQFGAGDSRIVNKSQFSTRRKKSSLLGSVGKTLLLRRRLKEPKIIQLDPPTGYPGYLTEDELEACLEFRRRLREGETDIDTTYRDMVSCFSEVEEEAYSICRYLRARKFNVDATFQMMQERAATWKKGEEKDFYPEAADAIGGAPESALLTQFPLVLGGAARNGCLVAYFTTKRLRIEGIECVTSMDNISNYVWHFAVHKLKKHIACILAEDPARFVRVQLVVAFDLTGLALNTLRNALGALEGALGVLSVFPELLSTVILLNVPRFFAPFWPIIKAFMDPDTANKFELYSAAKAGRKRLLELIDKANLASDYGGTSPSLNVEVALQGENSHDVDRQIIELLTVHKSKRSETACDIVLEAGEEATSVSVYTRAHDGATVNLYKRDEEDPVETVVMTRSTDQEIAEKNFFRSIAASMFGPARYRVHVATKGPIGREVEHFLVLADVKRT